jgi:hypothetical protein
MVLMPYSVLFLTGSFIRFPLLERVSKAKQLQLMTGVSATAYWLTCFLCDFLYYIIVAIIMVLVVLVADPLNVFNGSEELGMYVCIFKQISTRIILFPLALSQRDIPFIL